MKERLTSSAAPARLAAAALFLVLPYLASGCGSNPLRPREACLVVEASPSLNLYDGQAHALNLLLYPLTGPTGFEQASIEDLVGGRGVDGLAGPPISVMMSPGEIREVRELFPATTAFLGVVADYYQGGETSGNRRALIGASCSLFSSQKIALSARDLLVD